MKRTHVNNQLRVTNINETVTLIGWIAKRRHFGSIVFVDLRDRNGITQLVINEEKLPEVNRLKNEDLITATGTVVRRENANTKLETGEIEVEVASFELINHAKQPPLIIQDDTDALEETRMKYRYLDLRRPIMQQRLRKRHQIVKAMRDYLDDHGFIDVETPMLTKSTPEGSREYLVPSRVHPGEFYALAQSPQIFKQLLMIAGFERYYQVARCFRDEDLRADRQLDFTQVDIEASFLEEEEFQTIIEEMMVQVFKKALDQDLKVPFERIPFQQALNQYGSDKPDTRFELYLQDLSEVFKESEFVVFKTALQEANGAIKGLVVPNQAQRTRREIDGYTDLVKKYGAKGLVTLKYVAGQLEGSALKFLTTEEQQRLIEVLSLNDQDLVCIVASEWETACVALGALRMHFRDQLQLVQKGVFNFAWVTEFPMFEESEGRLVARHHPFTRPRVSTPQELEVNPLDIKAVAYDLVLNGFEVAGGSMRIYDGAMQTKLFEMIGFTPEQIQKRFGFFIDAFDYGTPPHGGIAFGLDRLVMVLVEADSIRDVIAFPKNASARDPLTMAPSPVSEEQLEELHLEIVKQKD